MNFGNRDNFVAMTSSAIAKVAWSLCLASALTPALAQSGNPDWAPMPNPDPRVAAMGTSGGRLRAPAQVAIPPDATMVAWTLGERGGGSLNLTDLTKPAEKEKVVAVPGTATAEDQTSPASRLEQSRFEAFGGYGFFSSGFSQKNVVVINGVFIDLHPLRPLNGWDVAFSVRVIAGLSLKADLAGYYGNSDYGIGGSIPQRALYQFYGVQYARRVRREVLFAESLVGSRRLNPDYSGGSESTNPITSLAYTFGGGLDTPMTSHLAVRIESD